MLDGAAKSAVHEHWDAASCGERYLVGPDDVARFEAQADARYRLEPFIFEFARFHEGRGRRGLEIGVGLGADFVQWLRAGARMTGVDLTARAVEQTRRRASIYGFTPDLHVADAEELPFDADTFDFVYSWGVLHHSPDTPTAVREVLRVLKPGGTARVMVYHGPSWVGWMLWARHAAAAGRPLRRARDVVGEHLESPGTKVYSIAEARALFDGFDVRRCAPVLCPADLLLNEPSAKHRGLVDRLAWRFWPRPLVRALGDRFGSFLLIEARKPVEEG